MPDDFDPNKWLQQTQPQQPPAPSGNAQRTVPWGETAKSVATTVWPYVTSFADQAARGFVGEAAQKGQDIGGYIPAGISEAYGDPELARTRQEALGTLTREYTGKEDPEHPITGAIGRFVGETAVPSAIAGAIPAMPLGKIAEKGLAKYGKWMAGDATKALKDATQGVAQAVRNPKTGRMMPNVAYKAAKKQNEVERLAAEEANKAAAAKAEATGAKWGGRVANVERTALAGALQPTQDPTQAAAIGGGTGVAIEIAKAALGPKFKGVISSAAALSAATAIGQILPGGIEHVALWGPAEWQAYKAMYVLADKIASGTGKTVSTGVGEAVTAGTVARGAEAIQGKDRPTITVPRRAQ